MSKNIKYVINPKIGFLDFYLDKRNKNPVYNLFRRRTSVFLLILQSF